VEISVQKDVKELLLNEWQLLGGVNAPKGSLKKLADKYNINDNTVRRWKAEHLKKNITNVRKEQTNKRTAKSRDIQIKKDILNDIPVQEIMARNDVSERTVQRKVQGIRELIKNRNTTLLENVSNKLIANKQEKLEEIKETKLNLIASINEAIAKREIQAVKSLNELLALIIKAEKELYKELRLKVTYEEAEFEKQLTEEETQRNRLEIEKLKQGTEEDKKLEIKIIGVD
jgi:transposase-like protein